MMKPEFVLKMKEQLKSEQAAYNMYKTMKEWAEDEYLEEALEEIMYDEFLHAKFLRSYMMDQKVYDPNQCVELEKAYQKMLED